MTDTITPAPPPDLLKLVQALAHARGTRSTHLAEQIRQALEQGADPNVVSKRGHTPLSLLANVSGASDLARVLETIQVLMRHGANAWHEMPALASTMPVIAHMAQGAAVRNGQPTNVWAHITCNLVEGILEQAARGVVHVPKRGGNALHAVAEHGLELVPYLLRQGRVPEEWIVQSNHQGHTPLHALWKPRLALDEIVELPERDRQIEVLWEGTLALLERGADPDQRDAQGHTPRLWIERRLRKGLPQLGPAWPMVGAALDATRLDRTTDAAGPGRGPGPRL